MLNYTPDSITVIISAIILILFFKGLRPSSTRMYNSEMVSLGVFGTFVGIFMGLLDFDTYDIANSLPLLLEGLKTAFVTSIVGLFFSIATAIIKQPKSDDSTTLLKDISNNQLTMIDTLERSLEMISTKANENIIASLEGIIKDFNNNLTEQFGDNFKQLNMSVKEMIVWQENHKGQVEQYESHLTTIFDNLKAVAAIKQKQEENIESLIDNLSKSSTKVTTNLEETIAIVKESIDLLLREANKGL